MTGNGIGVEEAKRMSEMLKMNTTLTSLNLGGQEKRNKDENNTTKRSNKQMIRKRDWR